MAKLTRVPAKVFAASAAADEIGQFGSAVAGSKLETSDVATIQGLSAWLDGWSEALVSGNRYPALQEMNGLLKVLSYQGAYALQEGIPEYDSATTYYIGSIVKKTGTFELYGSLTNDNIGNALTVDTEWKFLVDLNNVSSSAIVPLGSSTTASATAAKAVTLGITALTNGLTFLVSMTNANTATTITFNVDSLGAKNVYDKRGTQITGTLFSNAANEKILLRYNSTLDGFELITADFWSARMGMPSNSYIDLTLGISGSTYTAPADGYLYFSKLANSGQVIQMFKRLPVDYYFGKSEVSGGTALGLKTFMPVRKGDVIQVEYTASGATEAFRFIYAEGSKP